MNLNELEYINGEIFSNIWHSPRIARIDPRSGRSRVDRPYRDCRRRNSTRGRRVEWNRV